MYVLQKRPALFPSLRSHTHTHTYFLNSWNSNLPDFSESIIFFQQGSSALNNTLESYYKDLTILLDIVKPRPHQGPKLYLNMPYSEMWLKAYQKYSKFCWSAHVQQRKKEVTYSLYVPFHPLGLVPVKLGEGHWLSLHNNIIL